jgi:hypothetical protein
MNNKETEMAKFMVWTVKETEMVLWMLTSFYQRNVSMIKGKLQKHKRTENGIHNV